MGEHQAHERRHHPGFLHLSLIHISPVPEPLYRVPQGVRRDRRDSGRERRAQVIAYAQAFTARRPGAPLMRGWYSRLLQFFADVNGDTAAVPR